MAIKKDSKILDLKKSELEEVSLNSLLGNQKVIKNKLNFIEGQLSAKREVLESIRTFLISQKPSTLTKKDLRSVKKQIKKMRKEMWRA